MRWQRPRTRRTSADGEWINAELLIDTGVDRTDFTAVTDPTALDLCVLGRDILDLFALIIDRPGNIVCLLSQRHRYEIIKE